MRIPMEVDFGQLNTDYSTVCRTTAPAVTRPPGFFERSVSIFLVGNFTFHCCYSIFVKSVGLTPSAHPEGLGTKEDSASFDGCEKPQKLRLERVE